MFQCVCVVLSDRFECDAISTTCNSVEYGTFGALSGSIESAVSSMLYDGAGALQYVNKFVANNVLCDRVGCVEREFVC